MNPFDHIQRAKDHGKRKEKFIYTPCVICIRPDPLAYPHDHMQRELIPVSPNTHYEAQLRLLSNRGNQDEALQMISADARSLLCFNDPITMESLKRVTPPSDWYRKIEESVQYYDSVGENAPHCTMMSGQHNENCSISCTQVGRTTRTSGDYNIRYIKLWMNHAPVAYAFPVVVVPLVEKCHAYIRIVSDAPPPTNLDNPSAGQGANNYPPACGKQKMVSIDEMRHKVTTIKKKQLLRFLPKEELVKDEQMVYSNLDKILNEILKNNLYAAKVTVTEANHNGLSTGDGNTMMLMTK